MGLFDFFKKMKEKVTNPVHSSEIKTDIETQKRGYLELAEICLKESRRNDFALFIDNLKDYNGDEEFMTTLNYVIDYLYQNSYSLIICLDWKAEISSLRWGVDKNLSEKFDLKIELPQQENYGKQASVSSENVFKDFDNTIRKEGLQLSFIDTNSDEYIVVVHKIEDLGAAKSAIKNIGYDCLNANSRKISG